MSDIVLHKRTSADMIKELSQDESALVALLERVVQIETIKNAVKDVIVAARDFESNYTVPGKQRFQRVVRLRKALDELEGRIKKGGV